MLSLMFGVVVFLLVLAFLPDPEDTYNRPPPCQGHKWEIRKQPGVYDDDDKPVEYLYCTKCNKTEQEIMLD